jgi:hypothetical protein
VGPWPTPERRPHPAEPLTEGTSFRRG